MRSQRLVSRIFAVLGLAVILSATTFTQVNLPEESLGGPLTGAPVIGAPFSADATTTVHATLGDGTRLDQSTTDRYYRDSAGRVRVERWMGLPAPSDVSERWARTIIAPDPGDRTAYTADAETRSFVSTSRSIMALTIGGGRSFHIYIGGVRFVGFLRAGDFLSADPGAFGDVRDEPLGIKRIAGVEATGRRITIVVPSGYCGNKQPIEMTDERWESVGLKLLVQSWHSDSRSTIEYRLGNIDRNEPPAHLFEIPSDYTDGYLMTRNDRGMSFVLAEHFRADRGRSVTRHDDAACFGAR
jgi:hypothetical protein